MRWVSWSQSSVEMQAFPSCVLATMVLLSQLCCREVYDLDPVRSLARRASTTQRTGRCCVEVIVGRRTNLENVVLLEIEPEKQKTLPDFRVHEDRQRILTVDIARVVLKHVQTGLLYQRNDGTLGAGLTTTTNRAIVR